MPKAVEIGERLFSLTIEQIIALPDGTAIHGGHYNNLVKVGRYWIDPDNGSARGISDLFPHQAQYEEQEEEDITWCISSLPHPEGKVMEMQNALDEIKRACTETKLLHSEKIDSYRCLSNYVTTYIRATVNRIDNQFPFPDEQHLQNDIASIPTQDLP